MVASTDNCCVVTGVGILSPIGCSYAAFVNGLRGGVCGVVPYYNSALEPLTELAAGQVNDGGLVERSYLGSRGRFYGMASAAVQQAVDDAGLDLRGEATGRAALLVATAIGPVDAMQGQDGVFADEGAAAIDCENEVWVSTCGELLREQLGLQGECCVLTYGCSAGCYALQYARHGLMAGRFDKAVVCGVDVLSVASFIGYERFGILGRSSRPFDVDCSGIVPGEGAAALVLERADRAFERGATIYAELAAVATCSDAHQVLAPHPEGIALQRTMRNVLHEAALARHEVHLISASASGAPMGDRAELLAIQSLLGPYGDRVPTTAIKSQTGNCHGASIILEAIACIAMIREGFIAPTLGFTALPDGLQLKVVGQRALSAAVDVALCNATAFGGADSTALIRRYRREPA